MSGFAVIRHSESGGVGTSPAEAMDLHRANGWVRVSEYRHDPGAFNLADYDDDSPDLDAPVEQPKPEPKKPKSEPKPATGADDEIEE
jgi:hypothetical protein